MSWMLQRAVFGIIELHKTAAYTLKTLPID